MWLLLLQALALRLQDWRGLVGDKEVTWAGGRLAGATLDVEDASPLRLVEVIDLHPLAVASRTAKGLRVTAPLPADEVAVDAQVQDTAPAAGAFDNRHVLGAYLRSNGTWTLLARVRQHQVGYRCEAPFGLRSRPADIPKPPPAIDSDGWDHSCAAVPKAEAEQWGDQIELALELSPPEGICLPAGHWHWYAEQSDWAYAELRVLRTAPMVFFVPLGFTGGYFGVQDHGGDRYALFSLWDQGTHAEVVDLGEGVEARRFSGELRGMQTMKKVTWEDESVIRFLLRVEPGDERRFSSFWYDEAMGEWMLFATLRAKPCGIEPHQGLGKLNSFVEVFNLHDCISHRKASYSVWTASGDGPWQQARSATLTGTATPGKLRGLADADGGLVLDVGDDLPPEVGLRGENFTAAAAPVPSVLSGPKPTAGSWGPSAAGPQARPDFFARSAARQHILDERQPC